MTAARLPCTLDPETWFSDIPEVQERAVALCRRCPILARCAELGRGEEHGIWAGTTAAERLAAIQPAPVSEHGSRAAYIRGCRCRPCTDANSSYVNAWRSDRRWTVPVTPAPILFLQLSIEGIPA